ncbi:hypothetical protein SUGI_0763980 [Cryptomeria japonica]|nr:hypothetical protein SUGI_0763980 [Cryptomeria japonica]
MYELTIEFIITAGLTSGLCQKTYAWFIICAGLMLHATVTIFNSAAVSRASIPETITPGIHKNGDQADAFAIAFSTALLPTAPQMDSCKRVT